MAKEKSFRAEDIERLRNTLRRSYLNKYFNMFMHEFKWTGITPEQENYIMKRFWWKGTVAAFNIKFADELGFTDWEDNGICNIYNFPEKVLLINKYQLPIIPSGELTVNKDVVLGWIQPGRNPVSLIVEDYIDRMVQIDMVINTNLNTHKMPFLIGINPTDVKKANDIVNRILNDETVVFMDVSELSQIQTLSTNAPYIIDKLYEQKINLENELLTYLGLDNNTIDESRVLVDQVNANNQMINANKDCMLHMLETFAEQITNVLGHPVSVEPTQKNVDSVYDNSEEVNDESNMD